MTIKTNAAFEEFLLWLRVERGRAPNTLASYRRDLAKYQAWLEEHGLEHNRVDESALAGYVNHLKSSAMASSSIKRNLVTIRGFHRFIAEEGMGVDPTTDLEIPKAKEALPKALSEAEIESLIESIVPLDPTSIRDRAIVEVLYAGGLRISELTGLSLSDLDLESGLARVFGKGSKERILPLGSFAIRALVNWLGPQGRTSMEPDRWKKRSDADAVFLNKRGARLTRQGAWLIIQNAGERVGLADRLSPHVLRHSCATHMLNHGADIRTVQELLGHASISTTQVYTKVSKERLQEVYRTSHPRAVLN